MRKNPYYPNIPQYRTPRRVPFDPSFQPDIQQLSRVAEAEKTTGSPSLENYVVSTYDVLLPRGIRLYQPFLIDMVTIDLVTVSGEVTFAVPDGRTLVLREIILGLFSDGVAANNPLAVTPGGVQNPLATGPALFTLQQNGAGVEAMTDVEFFAPTGLRKIPVYQIYGPNENYGLRLFLPWDQPTQAQGVFVGDLLQTRGVDPILEPVGIDPVPVKGV